MSDGAIGREIAGLTGLVRPLLSFIEDSTWARRQREPGICDMTFGNPHEMPVQDFSAALARWSQPRHKDWFAYTMSDPTAVATLAASLHAWRGVAYEEADICLTNGAFGGLAACLRAVVDAGDEVIYVSPPWFFYPPMIATLGARPVRVDIRLDDFDLDLDAIQAAITPRTRAIIVNSPHNPTGKIYGSETLSRLAAILTAASERQGRPIYLLSDEAYSRIIYDRRPYHSPTTFYPYSFLIYTYGKTLLTPGQRLGFVALPPEMPERELVRGALLVAQVLTGWAFPNALLQHALAEIDPLSIDLGRLQARRDRLVAALRAAGYEVHAPEGTFYLLPRAPGGDDARFCELLAEEDVFVLPGATFDLPGYFRISLTANDEMIERALPAFRRAINRAMADVGVAMPGTGA
jgi:aspartate aminotransferase